MRYYPTTCCLCPKSSNSSIGVHFVCWKCNFISCLLFLISSEPQVLRFSEKEPFPSNKQKDKQSNNKFCSKGGGDRPGYAYIIGNLLLITHNTSKLGCIEKLEFYETTKKTKKNQWIPWMPKKRLSGQWKNVLSMKWNWNLIISIYKAIDS